MNFTFPGFGSGELSSSLQGRVDLAAFKYGCAKMRNMIPTRVGGAYQRPGFMTRGHADDQTSGNRVNLIPFVASSSDAYVIEAGVGYFRFWKDAQLLLTQAANVGKPGVISLLGDPLKIATPYDLASLFELQYAHANDVMWLAHVRYPVQKLERYAEDQFQFSAMTFVFPPLQDQNVDEITLAATGDLDTGGVVTLTAAGGDVFDPSDVGSYYGIDHRRDQPYVEISLSKGSGTASDILTITAQPSAGETFTIGKEDGVLVYTWANDGPYGVPIGTDEDDSIQKATDAVNGAAGSNPGTIAHTQVEADNLGKFTTGIKSAGILAFTDNNLTAGGSPDEFIIDGIHWAFTLNAASGPANRVQEGATLADSIQNAILAINGTGVAGVNYTAGTVASSSVTADTAPIGSTLRVVANTAGVAGNSIATTVDHTSRMSWGASTLTGGADAGTWKMQVTARIEGSQGNSIAVAETMVNGAWDPAAFLTGGADNTNYDPSNPSADIPTVRVTGTWEVYTLGRWYGTLTLQQQRSTGEWETVRTWTSQNDRNEDSTGTVDGEKTMRLIFVGAGIVDDEAPARARLTATDAIVNGLVLITAVADSMHATGTVIKPIWSSDPTYLWSHGSWNARYGYPSAVVLHQQRLVFGQYSRITGSQTGGFDNFFRGELDDDSYQFELAATVQQSVVSLQSQRGLIILTDTNEWLADGGQEGAVITPSAFRTEQLSAYGSNPGVSQLVHNNVLFIQRGGRILNEYMFQFANQNYEAVDLTELVDTLTEEILLDIAWAPSPHSLVMCVTESGSLLIMGYRRTQGNAGEGGQLAWSKHTTPNGIVESVCAIPAGNGITDIWAVVKRRLPSGSYVRTVESWDLEYWPNLQNGSAAIVPEIVSLDGSIRVSGVVPASNTITGLGHLEGLTVAVMAAGCRIADYAVNGGAIIITPSQLPATASTVVVGLAVEAELQPFLTVVQLRDGLSEGKTKRVAKLNFRLWQSGAAKYKDTDGAKEWKVDFRTPQDDVNFPVPLFTGIKKQDLAGGWALDTSFAVVNSNVLPMNVLNITAEMVVAG